MGLRRKCVELIVDTCDLARLGRALSDALSRAGFGGLLKIMVYLCPGTDYGQYIRELNRVIANNYSTSMIIYEYRDIGDLMRGLGRDLEGCGSREVISLIEMPSA